MRVAGFSTSTRGRSLWRESNGSSTGSERKFLFRMVSGGKIWITGRSFQHSPYPRFDSAVFSTPAASDCAFWHGQIGPVQMTSECHQMLAGLDSRNFARRSVKSSPARNRAPIALAFVVEPYQGPATRLWIQEFILPVQRARGG